MTQKEQARLQVLNSLLTGHMTTEQAATLMGVSTRHTRRILAAYRREGAAAIAHGNRGRRPANATAETMATHVVDLARTRYAGVNHTHLSELLRDREGIEIGRTTLRRILVRAGLNSPRRRRPPKHRVRRQRMAREGMLIQIDGSYHRWLGEDGPQFTLLLAVDDATGCIVNALFCELENTRSYFLLMRDLIQSYGIPLALYSDRHAVFKHTPPSETAAAPTQFSRAMGELGVQLIFARSPQAKGRVERTAGTLQDRLVSELWLAGATTIDDANRVLQGFLPRFNSRFKVPHRSWKSPTVPWKERCVSKGYCASSTGAESPETTLSDTAGAPCSCCPARTDRATPEQSSMCWRGWTVAWKLSTKDSSSLHGKHRRVQACCADSLGEPSTRLPLNSPTTVWVEDGSTGWRRWTPPTVPNDLLPSLIAMGLKVFAKLRVSDAGSPRHYRRPDGKRCRRRSARDCPFVGSPESWVYTETP